MTTIALILALLTTDYQTCIDACATDTDCCACDIVYSQDVNQCGDPAPTNKESVNI